LFVSADSDLNPSEQAILSPFYVNIFPKHSKPKILDEKFFFTFFSIVVFLYFCLPKKTGSSLLSLANV
jgi:hypothetical protein